MGWFWDGRQQQQEQQQQPSRTEDIFGLKAGNGTHNDTTSTSTSGSAEGGSPSQLSTVGWCIVTGVIAVGGPFLYKSYFRRIRNVGYLKPSQLKTKKLLGYVTRVGDGDNFRFYHTPGGRLAGWHWLRKVPEKMGDLKDETLHIRIAGIDAPELPHFGRAGQPYGQESLDWLNNQLLHRCVRVKPLAKDQYERVVASVRMPYRFWNRDPGLQMIKAGWATVYEAKTGTQYDGQEQAYRDAEAKAKAKGMGMWGGQSMIGKLFGKKREPLESPRDFKARSKKVDSMPK